jgi:hypothetical protein
MFIFSCFCHAHLCLTPSSRFSVCLRALGDLFSVNLCAAIKRETLSRVLHANMFRDVTFLFVSLMRLRLGIFKSSQFIFFVSVLCFCGLA